MVARDRQRVIRDSIYMKQELEITDLKSYSEMLKSQIEQLNWLNGENESKLSTTIIKYEKKKQKIKEERWVAKIKYDRMCEVYSDYIKSLKKQM